MAKLQTFLLVGGDHLMSHWDDAGFPFDLVLKKGCEINTTLDLATMFRGKFRLVTFNPNAKNLDDLFNSPPPNEGGDNTESLASIQKILETMQKSIGKPV
jgi:hypothetical protein